MATSYRLLQRLTHTFGAGVEVQIAERLLDFLSKHKATTHINLQLMRQLQPGATAGEFDRAIVRTLQYLAGDAVRVLETRFEILDQEDHPHDLTDEEARAALLTCIHPLTGEQDLAIAERVIVYFSPLAAFSDPSTTEETRPLGG